MPKSQREHLPANCTDEQQIEVFFIANLQNLDRSYEIIHSISCELEQVVRQIHPINVREDIYPELYDSANGTYQLNDCSVLEHVERDTEFLTTALYKAMNRNSIFLMNYHGTH